MDPGIKKRNSTKMLKSTENSHQLTRSHSEPITQPIESKKKHTIFTTHLITGYEINVQPLMQLINLLVNYNDYNNQIHGATK